MNLSKPANEPRPAALQGTIRHCHMLLRCGETYVLDACAWPLKLVLWTFQSQQMSHDQLPFEGTIRHCHAVKVSLLWRNVRFGRLRLAFETCLWLAFATCSTGRSNVRFGGLQLAFEAWLPAHIGFGSICVSKRANEPRPAALRRHI